MNINTQNSKEGLIERIIEFSARNKFIVLIFVSIFCLIAFWSMKNIPLDAIPDLSDTQVIIYSKWDRSPDMMEDQVTYPIVSSLLGIPNVKAVRGISDFGFSYVSVIFKDGTDIYWARSRTLEYLNKILSRLPSGVKTELGPDATGVGWVFQYALVDKSGKHDLQELRSFQDWSLRTHLQSVSGVAEVASIGGFVKQYQITIDPNRLLAYNLSITDVMEKVRQSNNEVGGRLLEMSGAEYMVRARGYIKSIEDIENIALGSDQNGAPILIRQVAKVAIGPDIRRGVVDLDGEGDVVGGTVIMRFGENALNVINRVKDKLKEIEPTLPEGVKVEIVYDRSELILKAIDTLKHQLIEEMLIVSAVIIIFLWHFPSAAVPIITIPIAVLLSFIPLSGMKLTANIMMLSGIAISIGVLVDGAIIEVENAYKRIEEWIKGGRKGDYHDVLLKSLKEVGPSVFFSLLLIAVSFLPIFTLLDQEGRLFRPLAWSKNLAMAIAAILAITLNPAMRMMFTRVEPFRFKNKLLSNAATTLFVGKYFPEEYHPISRRLHRIYEPVCRWVLKHSVFTIGAAVAIVLSTIPVYLKFGHEFMPPLWEGNILYMPTTLPGISVTEAQKLMQTQDQILKSFPEVDRVFGKAGRIESSTDPAPFSMMETVVLLKPEQSWREINGKRITHEQLIEEMDQALKLPGVSNGFTLPIKNRIDMLSTGVRTPIGVKVLGSDLKEIEKMGIQIEGLLKEVRGTRSVFAERAAGGYFIDFDIKREKIARYGLTIDDVQAVILTAIGGEEVTTTVEGRERYSVNVRYARDFRHDVEGLKRVFVTTDKGVQVPIGEVADISLNSGPAMIRNENGLLAGYVYVDVKDRDIGGYVSEAKQIVSQHVKIPPGYNIIWSGQYENMIRVKERLKIVLPMTLFLICFLLYLNTKSMVKTGIVLLAVPFSLVGAVWLLWFLDYNVSIAVWVGMIALMGLDAETGVFMLLFLDLAYKDAKDKGKLKTKEDLVEVIIHGAVKRVRPKMMTVIAAFAGLLPIMWSTAIGSDMMKRIAAPMVGGLATSFILELLVYPVLFFMWKWHFEVKGEKLKYL